jgi:hypothetical protein
MPRLGMRSFLFSMGLCVLLGTGFVVFLRSSYNAFDVNETASAQTRNDSRFRYVGGYFAGDYATYWYQTPPEEKHYADDCIGCKEEIGNSTIFAEFGCREKAEYLFKSNSELGVVETTPILDSEGKNVGERRSVLFEDKIKKQVVGARLFWIEGQDFWAVQAPNAELTRALFQSEEYKSLRKKVSEELKSFIPIQNANTIGKDPCKDFTQRRIQH